MSAVTTLNTFNPRQPTRFVSNACPKGIANSVYQERKDGSWEPVDHLDRGISAEEQGPCSPIEREALAKVWGIKRLRAYLSDKHFTAWGDF